MASSKQSSPQVRPRLAPTIVDASPEVLARESTAHAEAIARLERSAAPVLAGAALPEGEIAAVQGTLYVRQAGDASSLWFKQTGTGPSGWVQIVVP